MSHRPGHDRGGSAESLSWVGSEAACRQASRNAARRWNGMRRHGCRATSGGSPKFIVRPRSPISVGAEMTPQLHYIHVRVHMCEWCVCVCVLKLNWEIQGEGHGARN